jgi:PHP family Zn ribbon phosphoesterase
MTGVLADLHIHTALSPCAERTMRPRAIVEQALRQGLAMIAICDHNSAANAAAVCRAAEASGPGMLTVIPGIEISTVEEVHVLGLFPTTAAALEVSARVRESLPEAARAGGRTPPFWSEQLLLDDQDRQLGVERRMLGLSCALGLSETVALIRENRGLAVAAHVDRPSFSVLTQLGFLPEGVTFDALEISAAGVTRGRAEDYHGLGIPLISGSDGHSPEEIGSGCTALLVEEPSFEELRKAVSGCEGRRCAVA